MEMRERLARIEDAMAEACARRGRRRESVRMLAATKTVGAERIREAHGLGVRLFGENRVQEREAKRTALVDLPGAEWHLLGPLQSNKAGKAADLFDLIETVDTRTLAERLARKAGRRLAIFLEVNIGGEAQKHGVPPGGAAELAAAVRAMPELELRGLMTVPPQTERAEEGRRHFAALAELAGRLGVTELSMGMSHDFAVAIEEGATEVRIGSALFGARR